MATFVQFLELKSGDTIDVNVADPNVAYMSSVPTSVLTPISQPNGTYIWYDDGLRIAVRGTLATTVAAFAGGGIAPSKAVYLDTAGNDATGQRGSAVFPFLTLSAALAVCQSGDELLVSPGNYTGTLNHATIPAIANLIIRGSGEFVGDTVISGAAAEDVLTLNAANRSILIDNIQLAGLTSGRAIVGTGATAAGAWLSNTGLVLQDCTLASATGNSLVLTDANLVIMRDTICGDMSFTTCSGVILQSATTGTISWTFDNTDANKPALGQSAGLSILPGTVTGAITLGGQAKVNQKTGAISGNITALNLSVAAGPVSPSIIFNGTVGTVDLSTTTAALPSAALGAYTVSFAGATIGATFLARVASGATRQPVSLVGALNAGAVAITSDALCDIVAQGAAFKTPTYTSLNTGVLGIGTLQPPSLTITAANTNPTTFTFPNTLNVPTGYGIAAINSTAAGAVTAATTASATQVVTTHAGATGNTTITLLWP